MARSRNIKPGFFLNDVLGALPPLARLMFAGLWTACDREGRILDRPTRIKAEVLPYDDCDPDELLGMLASSGFIDRYEVGGLKVIQVCAWGKHQNPHVKEQASTLPRKPEHQTCTGHAPCKHEDGTSNAEKSTELAGLIPSSLIPSSLIPSSILAPAALVPPASRRAVQPSEFLGDANLEAMNGRGVATIGAAWELPDSWGKDAEALGWKPAMILKQAELFRQYWTVGRGQGTRRSVKGWRQSWSNWLSKAERMAR